MPDASQIAQSPARSVKKVEATLRDFVTFTYEYQSRFLRIPPNLTYQDLFRRLREDFDIPPQDSSKLYLEWEASSGTECNEEKWSNMSEVCLSPGLTVHLLKKAKTHKE